MLRKMPEPENAADTVLHADPDPDQFQAFYLWEEGKAPAQTQFTENMSGYFDSYDFRPYVTAIPLPEGVKLKGAVVLMAGGSYQFRGNYTDSLPTAAELRDLGFRTFIVDNRLSLYTQQEGALDVARAVRFIRKNADAYGSKMKITSQDSANGFLLLINAVSFPSDFPECVPDCILFLSTRSRASWLSFPDK